MPRKILYLAISVMILVSCDESRTKNKSIDYTNREELDSLIGVTPESSDTLFLGFVMGMTKSQYKQHIHALRDKGMTLTYSNSNSMTYLGNRLNMGAGYTFKTAITVDQNDKTYTGQGEYFLEPVYTRSNKLMELNIVPFEDWDQNEISLFKPKWLEKNIMNNSEFISEIGPDIGLKQALIDNDFIDSSSFIRTKGDVVIYKKNVYLTYVDRKKLLIELLLKETEKSIIQENNEEIKF